MTSFVCTVCGKKYPRSSTLDRHFIAAHGDRFQCAQCEANFTRQDSLKKHVKNCHNSNTPVNDNNLRKRKLEESIDGPSTSSQVSTPKTRKCEPCNMDVNVCDWPHHIRQNSHKKNSKVDIENSPFQRIRNCFGNKVETFFLDNKDEGLINIQTFLNNIKKDIVDLLNNSFETKGNLKFGIELFAEFVKFSSSNAELNDGVINDLKSFKGKMSVALKCDNLEEILESMFRTLQIKSEEFQQRDSGWALISIARLEVNINEYRPLRGSSYLKLPDSIGRKKACVNVQNKDIYCFKWAVISALYQKVKSAKRPSAYHVENIKDSVITLANGVQLDFTGLNFPLQVNEIAVFEASNPSVSINVFGIEKDEYESKYKVIGPYYNSKHIKNKHINMLLLQEGDCSHYVWIKNMSRLIGSQLNHGKRAVRLCNACLQSFNTEESYEKHTEDCTKMVTTLPNCNNNILKFNHHARSLEIPFTVYADFECMLPSIVGCSPNTSKSSTTAIKKHIPIAVSYFIKCSFDSSLNKLFKYTGLDCGKVFIDNLLEDSKRIHRNYLSKSVPMQMTSDDKTSFGQATSCHICGKLWDKNSDKVRDHDHMTGKFRGAAHSKCNLSYKVPTFIPIFFHNFTGYDSHLFIKDLDKIGGQISIVPLNKEKYISISTKILMNEKERQFLELRFLDSFRFLPFSIDTIAKTLSKTDFSILSDYVEHDEESLRLITRKGVFCYDYLDSIEKLDDTQLPSKDLFRNTLIEEDCTHEDYSHAQNVWSHFKCQNLRQYLEHYMVTDVLNLADIFERFRSDSRRHYGLDPCHYFTLPGFSWDAMLKITNIRLEILTDINMYKFFAKSIRGGLAQCSLRYCKANNKYMNDFDSNKPSDYLMYMDANNLYGWAMSNYLPHSGFKWVEPPIDLTTITDWLISNDNIGYVLEVDLDYPQTLHDNHNELPFCPTNKAFNEDTPMKLIADLNNKTNYVIHYKSLIQCIDNGLVLTKIHRIMQFNQSLWLKKYIDLNNDLRTRASTKFEKDLRKLCNNAVFGKSMENVDKRKDVRIVDSDESNGRHLGCRALIAKPNFHSILEIGESMAAVQLKRMRCFYNKPIYLGFCILDISKYKMYDFHYSYMKPKFCDNLKLAYMDTDSFIYQIRTEDFYNDIKSDIPSKFDTSDYAINNSYGIDRLNMKKLGFMKDEHNGKIMKEFVGLRAKMYSIDIEDGNQIKKAKGVKSSTVKKFTIDDYRACLFRNQDLYCRVVNFRSRCHNIYTECIIKLGLSCKDDKRYICENNFDTLAWGHYKIDSYQIDAE